MKRRWLHLILGFVALLMLADFVLRGIVPAFEGGKNDFSEIYVGAWMWRHGQNFYDAPLAHAVGDRIAATRVNIVLIYPPTALVLVAPFTFLPWIWANVLWLILGLAGIAATIALLIRIAGLQFSDDRALLLGTFVLAFDPLHQAFHLGNLALFVVPLCFLGIYFAEDGSDFWCGLALGGATALKPQLGIWALGFYLLQFRKRVFVGALVPAAGLAFAFSRYPVAWRTLIASYRDNLSYWFAPGRLYGFTEGALPFHVNNTQVVFYQFLHSVRAANVAAYSLFLCGLILWATFVFRARFRAYTPLALVSLWALSFLALYHSVSDATILTLALCWVFRDLKWPMDWAKVAACVLLVLLMLPGHAALMRLSPHISSGIAESWWWRLFVARYFVWLLVSLNVVLLFAVKNQAANRGQLG
ncbi:MAG TPA: glycosyltransferase family 87 protein [Candidatus Sulfotelmatobacter sp.]|jgi:hypothetical protein